MCPCASCRYTDSFAGKSFADWPRGDPIGRRGSDRLYAAHVRHVWSGAYKTVQFIPGQPPRYPAWATSTAQGDGGEHRSYPQLWAEDREKTTAEYVAEFIKENGYITQDKLDAARRYRAEVKRGERAARRREKASPTYAKPASPARPCKSAQHFPEQDRPLETAPVYARRGRPPIAEGGVKRVLVSLDAGSLARGRALGAGNLSAGIRKALADANA